MSFATIKKQRLASQQLTGSGDTSIDGLLSHFGAMQAQDYAMAKWAIGLRTGSDEAAVEKAISDGKIIRTHLLRPTWHFIAAKDIYWMLQLTAPHVQTIVNSSNKRLGLDEAILNRSKNIICRFVENGQFRTREEIMAELNASGINTTGLIPSHIMMSAELDGLVCNGPMRGKQFTYALLEERTKKTAGLSKEVALAKLATVYFTSHGPATLEDFRWWSGLSMANSRTAIELIKADFEQMEFEGQSYYFIPCAQKQIPGNVKLLPAFDEFLISYKDRTASIEKRLQPRAFTRNGIFNPVIVIDGKVEGIWKRTVRENSVIIEIQPFEGFEEGMMYEVEKTVRDFGEYLKKEIVLKSAAND